MSNSQVEEEVEETSHSACFYLTGITFTQLLRDMMLDDDHDRAMRTINAAIPELTLDQTKGVLSGELMFTGDTRKGGGLDLVEDDGMDGETEQYKAQLKERFAGYFRGHGGRWYVPEKKIHAYGLYNAGMGAPENTQAIQSYMPAVNIIERLPRSWRYSCRPVNPPPVWWKTATSFKEAIEELGGEDGNKLPFLYAGPDDWRDSMLGIKQEEFDVGMPKGSRTPAKVEEDGESPLDKVDDLLLDMAAAVGLSPEAARGVMQNLTGKQPTGLPEPVQLPLIDMLHGMVSPKGDFYPCEYMGHANLCHLLMESLGIDEATEKNYRGSIEKMLDLGWYQLGRKELLGFCADGRKEPTEDQWFIIDIYARLHAATDMEIFSTYHRKPGGVFR